MSFVPDVSSPRHNVADLNGKSSTIEMGKLDLVPSSVSVVRCIVLVSVFGQCVAGKPMSETLQRALSAVRGPSPGAKKLLNIPEDGGQFYYL